MHPQPNIAPDQISDFIWENLIISFPTSLWNRNLTLSLGISNQDYPYCFDCCLVSQSTVLNNAWFTFYILEIAVCWTLFAVSPSIMFKRPLLTHLQYISYFLLTEFTVGGDQVHNQMDTIVSPKICFDKIQHREKKSFDWSEWSQLRLMWENGLVWFLFIWYILSLVRSMRIRLVVNIYIYMRLRYLGCLTSNISCMWC